MFLQTWQVICIFCKKIKMLLANGIKLQAFQILFKFLKLGSTKQTWNNLNSQKGRVVCKLYISVHFLFPKSHQRISMTIEYLHTISQNEFRTTCPLVPPENLWNFLDDLKSRVLEWLSKLEYWPCNIKYNFCVNQLPSWNWVIIKKTVVNNKVVMSSPI